MNTIWNTTKEGRQYWVQVKAESLALEMVSDPVSELAGGGYCIDLPKGLEEDAATLEDLKKIFGSQALLEIIAFSRALQKTTRTDFNARNENFNLIYYRELEKIASAE